MQLKVAKVAIAAVLVATGCSTTSSSNVSGGAAGSAWEGPVLVSQGALPAGIQYKMIGSVQADARAGYDNAASLYPLLAVEAKKIGANAVVDVKGGHRVSAFSWAAPYVTGIAVKVDDPQKLKGLSGSFY
jgi:hypothetical protein